MTKDALLIALRDLRLQMRGINPKLSIYATLQQKEAELILRIGEDPGQKLINHNKTKREDRVRNIITHTGRRCQFPGCTNLGMVIGGKNNRDKFGLKKRRPFCDKHRLKNRHD